MANRSRIVSDKPATRGARIRWLRVKKEITQFQLAEACMITQSAISQLERDESHEPAASTLLLMAACLNSTPDYIQNGIGPNHLNGRKPDDETSLVNSYRKLTDEQKIAITMALDALTHSKPQPPPPQPKKKKSNKKSSGPSSSPSA